MSQLTANRFNDEHTLIYVQVRHALKITKDCTETAMEKTDLFEFDCKTFDEQQTVHVKHCIIWVPESSNSKH